MLFAVSSDTTALTISPGAVDNNRKRSWQYRDQCYPVRVIKSTRSPRGPPRFDNLLSRLYNSQDDESDSDGMVNPRNCNEESNQSKNDPQNSGAENDSSDSTKPNILDMINPYNAGKNLRSTVESAFNLASAIASTTSSPAARLPPERRAIYYNYYLDDKLGLSTAELKDSPEPSSMWSSTPSEDYRPEVLVVGATGGLGRVLVKRLLLENKVRVRVLVRDLYSNTLNKLGTGVTYCQGDLSNMESLEYAVTDLDKIVFCAGHETVTADDDNWNSLEESLAKRTLGAEKVDREGLRNLIHAYLNVRHADYGTSQTAKRVLFKFRKSSADFDLFAVDDGSVDDRDDDDVNLVVDSAQIQANAYRNIASLSQSSWKRNKFGHGVFTGQVLRQGEAAIASARLRSRCDPSEGLDLRSGGFGGLVCRVCSNGGVYEAFLRTEAYERLGVEYVCEFRTASKSPTSNNENTSRDKFSTVRLDFTDFRARMRPDARRKAKRALGLSEIPPFVGRDVRQLGFRYRGENNSFSRNGASNSGWSRFYLALDYIKLYRGQPEPEFIYLSDARIPPVVQDGMVRDDIHRLVSSTESGQSYNILDGSIKRIGMSKVDRIPEETYFKYKGEEIIKQSGLSYTIIRVAGYNESPSTDSSAVRLQKTNKDITSVSRADLAQVVASALLEPNACNLVLYMTKSQERGVADGNIWQKFARLRSEKLQEPFQ
ncbi:hypothetical protein HJC23_000292 [Cyclotella cryptica]|uniref:NAD(P)-binding domain-containing protein n=1 Tax=Cyclotella cryptica TaxID=29204 RepID=A0ABD3QCD0_9STRA